MKCPVVLSIDQGTTGTRAILYDQRGAALKSAYREFRQYYPKPGWVEHDPEEIWKSCQSVVKKSLQATRQNSTSVVSIGITNQRETTLVWDRVTGKPLHRAIVWQDRRTSALCASLKKRGYEKPIRRKTG